MISMSAVDSTKYHGSASITTTGILTTGSINWAGAIVTSSSTLSAIGTSAALVLGNIGDGKVTLTAPSDLSTHAFTFPSVTSGAFIIGSSLGSTADPGANANYLVGIADTHETRVYARTLTINGVTVHILTTD